MTTISVMGMDDPDDPIVWERSRLLPNGQFRIIFMTRSNRDNLVALFGQEWYDNYLRQEEEEFNRWGVH